MRKPPRTDDSDPQATVVGLPTPFEGSRQPNWLFVGLSALFLAFLIAATGLSLPAPAKTLDNNCLVLPSTGKSLLGSLIAGLPKNTSVVVPAGSVADRHIVPAAILPPVTVKPPVVVPPVKPPVNDDKDKAKDNSDKSKSKSDDDKSKSHSDSDKSKSDGDAKSKADSDAKAKSKCDANAKAKADADKAKKSKSKSKSDDK